MLVNTRQFLCTLVPTALSARYQARLALGEGEYGRAADYYITATRRLGDRVLAPFRSQPLFPDCLSQCVRAAYRTAIEENQQVKKSPCYTAAEMSEDKLHMFLGADILYGHSYFTRDERLLLLLHDPLAAVALLGDPYHFSRKKDGIRGLFRIRYLAALAERGDNKAMRNLMDDAIHSNSALRALNRMEDANVPGVAEIKRYVDSQRHGMFLARQEDERQRQEAEAETFRIACGLPPSRK